MRRWLVAVLLLLQAATPAWATPSMRITNLSDFALGNWNIGDPAIQQHIDICIYGTDTPALLSYAITVSSSPSGFKAANTVNSALTVPYSLNWSDSVLGVIGSQLSDGVKLSGLLNLNNASQTCAITGANARLTVTIAQANMTNALAGTYTSTITLLLSAN